MTPKALVNAIETRVGVTGSPREVRDAIENELLCAGVNPASAAEQVDQFRSKVAEEIIRRSDERASFGEIAVLGLRGTNKEFVFGSCFVFPDDSVEIKQAKQNRVLADQILDHLRSLTFSEFESFGRAVLREIGCATARVTPHAGDQGIDFYGELNVGNLMGTHPAIMKLMHETRLILVGQAKHYPDVAIGPSIVRELVGALSLSRTATFSRDNIDLLNDVQLRPFSPILALLFSTGKITKGARHLAMRAGLIAFSGLQLAVFLADRGVGIVNSGGAIGFAPQAFDAWLAGK